MNQNKLSKKNRVVFGLIFFGVGLVFILVSFDIIQIAESEINSPRWVLGLCGFVFALAGVMIFLGENSGINNLLAALMILSFGCIGAWVTFYGDAADFSGGLPFLSNESNVILARTMFGISTAICFAISAYAIRLHLRSKNQ